MHLSCICASKFAPEGQLWLQLAPFLRISRRGWVLVCVSRPRSTRHFSGLLFCPSRAPSQCFSKVPGASQFRHRLSSFLLTKYGPRGCNVAGCTYTNVHRSTQISGMSSPLQKPYLVMSNKDSIVFRLRPTCYPSSVGSFHHSS